MAHALKNIFLFISLSVFLIPLAVGLFGFEASPLHGVHKKKRPLRFTLTDFWNTTFQERFEDAFISWSNVKSILVKSDTQLNYSLFNQLSSNTRANVLLGNKDELFERLYVKSLANTKQTNQKRLKNTAKKIATLNRILDKKGIPLLLVVSPSKAHFYPQHLPSWYQTTSSTKMLSVRREFMLAEFDRYNIPYIDGHSLLKRKEEKLGQAMFANTGTHWNQLGGCLVAQAILQKIQQLRNTPMPKITCRIAGERQRPVYPDTDLLRLANLLLPEVFLKPAPLVVTEGSLTDSAKASNLLLVGSSFCWELLRQFEASKVIWRNDLLYYFKRSFISSADSGKKINRSTYDFETQLADRTAVIIEINEASLGKASFGFAKTYIDSLKSKTPGS